MDEDEWTRERSELLGRRISDLGLRIPGTRIERLVQALYEELDARGLRFHPPVYLSDQWGCPDETPLIGIPFYLADPRLERIEEEMSQSLESDEESMRYLRHEAGHAFNYAFRLYEREDWHETFGAFKAPYLERYPANPFSRDHVRHILGWYAQKHPDEDFAETFAVWLTPGANWREEYARWPAIRKLQYVERVMNALASRDVDAAVPQEDDLPVESMRYSVQSHYREDNAGLPLEDDSQFDQDLRQIFVPASQAPAAEAAAAFLTRHYREIVSRVAFWTSEPPGVVRSLLDFTIRRAGALELRSGRLDAATLIEFTAFATAVMMMYRTTHVVRRPRQRSQAASRAGRTRRAAR